MYVPAAQQDAFGSELLTAFEASRHSIMPATQSNRATIFNHWVAFCHGLGHDPVLSKVPFALQLNILIVFGCRYRWASYPSIAWSPFDLSMGQRPYALLARSSHNWGLQILEWINPVTNTDSAFSIKPGMMRIQPPHEFGLLTSPFSDPWSDDSSTILSPTEPMLSLTCVSLDSFSCATQVSMPSPPLLS